MVFYQVNNMQLPKSFHTVVFLLSLLVVAIPRTIAKDDPFRSNHVIDLTASEFYAKVGSKEDTWFIEFYAPWCGHCKRFAPQYEELAKNLEGKIYVAKIDATKVFIVSLM